MTGILAVDQITAARTAKNPKAVAAGNDGRLIAASRLAAFYPVIALLIAAPEGNFAVSKAEAGTFTKQFYAATVVRVLDGDTIVVNIPEISKDYHVKVHYIGIDTPELHHSKKLVECFAKEAKEQNVKLVEGKAVTLELDAGKTDRYERLLAYVHVGDGKKKVFVNDWLVRNGYARVMTIQPNMKYQAKFMESERYARENKLGFWADGACD